MRLHTTVYTETICSCCGRVSREEGANGDVPPVGWSSLDITQRLKGEGWTNNTKIREGPVCQPCVERVEKSIKDIPRFGGLLQEIEEAEDAAKSKADDEHFFP